MKSIKLMALCTTAIILAGCASTPMGPTISAVPPPGKNFDQFEMDQDNCKQYANSQVSGQAEDANTTGILEGVGGTILGAGLGAALGGGHGAAIGAAGGAIAGTAVGASSSGSKQGSIQQQYNNAYKSCMVAKGNRVEQRPVVYMAPTVVYAPAPPPPTVIYAAPPPPPPPAEVYPY